VAKTVVDLLDRHPLVVLTGTNQPFVQNRNIGKTLACKSIRQHLVMKGRSIFYIDIKHALGIGTADTSYVHLEDFSEMVTKLSRFGALILDEAHYAFPRDPACKLRDWWGHPIYRGEQYNNEMFAFWKKLAQFMMEGTRLVMITALHPLDPLNQHFLVNEDIALYYSAPTVELALLARQA
jgi:hypothetical protein